MNTERIKAYYAGRADEEMGAPNKWQDGQRMNDYVQGRKDVVAEKLPLDSVDLTWFLGIITVAVLVLGGALWIVA